MACDLFHQLQIAKKNTAIWFFWGKENAREEEVIVYGGKLIADDDFHLLRFL